jgi:hypothetical protein
MTLQNKTKGVLLFAKNNPDFNYVKQAIVCATLAKHYLNVPVALVTDKDELTDDISIFDIVIDYKTTVKANVRPFYIDGKPKRLQWHNIDRLLACELSPFDETLVLDTDYLIQNNVLNQVWGCNNPMLMNTDTRLPSGPQLHVTENVIADGFPPVHWFTVMYFKKCDETKLWFDFASFVKENHNFYKKVFRSPYHYYRNDIVAAITSHIIGGYEDGYMKPLPTRQINSYPPEQILQIDHGKIVLNTEEYPVLIKDTNIHIVNKLEIERNFNRFMEIYA